MNLIAKVLIFYLLIAVSQGFNLGASTSLSKISINMDELTFVMIKPDGVQRRLVGSIIERFEKKGLTLRAMKLLTPSEGKLKEHYHILRNLPFFPKLIRFMSSGPVVAMVWEGRNAVKVCRTMLGATNPIEALPGTIRGDFATVMSRNVCHASDSVNSANKEIDIWFPEGVLEYDCHSSDWIGD